MARTPQSTLTCTMRSSEHGRAPSVDAQCSHIALVAQGLALCVIPYHPCMRTCVWCLELSLLTRLSTSSSSFLFQLYLMSIPAPDEISIEDPLCNSSLGSMVTLDYVTPDTGYEPKDMELLDINERNLAALQRCLLPERPGRYSFLPQRP